MQTPLVSICIPTYNGEKYITEAMDSAINQTYSNLETIVSDDASKDNTLLIIQGYHNKTSIPISIYNHKPQGIGANWDNCIKKAKGDYIKFLFQDDVLNTNCVNKMIEVASINENVGFIDEELIKFRLHSEQATKVNRSITTKESNLFPLILFKYIFKYRHDNQQKKLLEIKVENTKLYVIYNHIRKKIKI